MLTRDRTTRLMRTVMQWTVDDVMEWCAHYEIDLGDCEAIEVGDFAQFIKTIIDDVMEWCAHYEIDLGDCEAIEVSDFAQFIKANDGSLDGIDLTDSLCDARDCLRREECAFYCAKHSIKLVEAKGDKMET
eukprot:755575_1